MLKHITVLKNESIEGLNINPKGIYVDATLGAAGHSYEILKRLTTGHLYVFDQDQYAIDRAQEVLKGFSNYTIIKANFSQLKEKLNELGIMKIDGILFDLGLSSFQIDDVKRGFSYMNDYDLDMRMDQSNQLSAKMVVNEYSLEELVRIFREYGEEKNAYLIARSIVANRPLNTTAELVKITDKYKFKSEGHSAKRVFQALRIEVNQELSVLRSALNQALDLLNVNARLAVITFHSLEDKIVKHFIKEHSTLNVPKNLPLINIQQPPLINISKKAILPSLTEINENSRSRSAKLRIAQKS